MTLTALGPAGTAHDPFRGGYAVAPATVDYTFPRDRYAALDVDEDLLDELADVFAGLDAQQRAEAHEWIEQSSDDDLRAQLDEYRETRDAYAALAGLTDEQREQLAALSDGEREALASLTAEDVEALRAAESAAESSGPDSEPTPGNAPDGDAPPQDDGNGDTSTEQQPDETVTFSAEDVPNVPIPVVQEHVEAGRVTPADALAAEQQRADGKVRSSLVEWLTARTT